jgi:hypothetical protein
LFSTKAGKRPGGVGEIAKIAMIAKNRRDRKSQNLTTDQHG